MAQRGELATLLVHLPLDRADAQALGNTKRIRLVALRTTALAYRRHDHLLDMRRKDLVQPTRQRAFLQAYADFRTMRSCAGGARD